eukprot:198056-Amphidinium_carterae.1
MNPGKPSWHSTCSFELRLDGVHPFGWTLTRPLVSVTVFDETQKTHYATATSAATFAYAFSFTRRTGGVKVLREVGKMHSAVSQRGVALEKLLSRSAAYSVCGVESAF